MRIVWIGAAVFVAVYAVYAFVTVDRRSDEVVIRSIITDASSAAGNRNAGGVVTCLSRDYRDDAGNSYLRLRQFVAQAMKAQIDYSVQTNIGEVNVEGSQATVDVAVKVTQARSADPLYERLLTVHFSKEPGRHALVVPVKVWRVTTVDNLGLERLIGDEF